MIAQCTLKDVVDRVQTIDQDNWDTVVPVSRIQMEHGQLLIDSPDHGVRHALLQPNEWAASQLCSKVGIPAGYFERCPSNLKDEQFNYWLGKYRRECGDRDPSWLLRVHNSSLRGVLSSRYSPLDNSVLVGHLERLQDSSMVVQSVEVTDVSFHLRLVKPMTQRPARVGDELFAGVHIANSEVGLRAVTVDALVYRKVCTNGLIVTTSGGSLFKKRHVGIRPEDLQDALPTALSASMREAEMGLERFVAATAQPVSDPNAAIRSLAKQHQLSEVFVERSLHELAKEHVSVQETKYGLINALTGAARESAPDERYRIEQLAGLLLTS